MDSGRQTLMYILYTIITLLTGFITLVQNDVKLRAVNHPEIIQKVQVIIMCFERMHVFVRTCPVWLDILLQVMYYGGQIGGMCLLIYVLKPYLKF